MEINNEMFGEDYTGFKYEGELQDMSVITGALTVQYTEGSMNIFATQIGGVKCFGIPKIETVVLEGLVELEAPVVEEEVVEG